MDVTCKDIVVILSSEQRHQVGSQCDLWNFSCIRGLQRGKLTEIKTIMIRTRIRRVFEVLLFILWYGRYVMYDFYLWQLLSNSNLNVRAVINLEPGWLEPASPVPLGDDSLSSPPVKVYLGINI